MTDLADVMWTKNRGTRRGARRCPTSACGLLYALGLCVAVGGCDSKADTQQLAPATTALTADVSLRAADKVPLEVATSQSEVGFQMDAPLEKIFGDTRNAVSGEVTFDLSDLRRSAGLVDVDLDNLILYQAKRESPEEGFAERSKSDLQNEHARAWLEISADAPPQKRVEYRQVQFKFRGLDIKTGPTRLELTEGEQVVRAEAKGEFRLHGRTVPKTVELKISFKSGGGKLLSAQVTTVSPFPVGLEEHDVRPRESFGVLAQKTLAALAPKVATEAAVSLSIRLVGSGSDE